MPTGLIDKSEISEDIGLIYYNQKSGALTTKRKALYRNVEFNAELLLYVIMNRIDSERAPFAMHKEDVFKAWLENRENNKELSKKVRSKLLEDNARLEKENQDLKYYKECADKLDAVSAILKERGVKHWSGNLLEKLEQALSVDYPLEIDGVLEKLTKVKIELELIKKRNGGHDDGQNNLHAVSNED